MQSAIWKEQLKWKMQTKKTYVADTNTIKNLKEVRYYGGSGELMKKLFIYNPRFASSNLQLHLLCIPVYKIACRINSS